MGRNNFTRAGISAQTSMDVTGTSGWYEGNQSSLRFVSAHNSAMTAAGYNAIATTTSQHHLASAFIKTEVETNDESSPNPSTSSQRRDGPRRSSEGMKAKAQYKAALKIQSRLQDRVDLSVEERESLAWAEKRIEESRLHFANIPNMKSTSGFANKVEEMFANKKQRSGDIGDPVNKRQREPRDAGPSPIASGPASKRQREPRDAGPSTIASGPPRKRQREPRDAGPSYTASGPASKWQREPRNAGPSTIASGPASKWHRGPKNAEPPPIARKPNRRAEPRESQVHRQNLIVALIDRSDENGQMTEERWKTVNARLVKSLFAQMEGDPNAPMPTFDGAGWLNGVKILKCMDVPTLKWLTQTVYELEPLWEGAELQVVNRYLIPSKPKAKVLFPIAVQKDHALKLLQRQNPDVPTADWKILHLANPQKEGGQSAILQINKEAEDILYPRYGKMAWGMGCVYLRLKKRHPGDMDAHTLQAGEVEMDLGLNNTVTLNESDAEEDDLAMFEIMSGRGVHSTYDT
ncbi:hypothetical protein KR200_003473 [Drosophila serrata]|nr:hypothetical protein KR200_003473 [Drosophila serrata]